MIYKILSYFYPITISKSTSAVSKTLEVTWNNGKLVLDTENANYSYGSLQRILRRGLAEIGPEKIRSFEHVLVLGVAAGSVIHTLYNEIGFTGHVLGVDLDPQVIEIANKHFGLSAFKNLKMTCADAEAFIKDNTTKYDLIVVDIFQDTSMPEFVYNESFTNGLDSSLKSCGAVLFNTMVSDSLSKDRNLEYIKRMEQKKFTVSHLQKVDEHNELIVCFKKS